jgi:hypothetical protein
MHSSRIAIRLCALGPAIPPERAASALRNGGYIRFGCQPGNNWWRLGVYRFHARDLHFVLGPSKDGKPIRFRVTLDGKRPGADHGMDIDADGYGTVTEDRLYQLIRQQGSVWDRTFRIEFLVPGVQAYSFTFG